MSSGKDLAEFPDVEAKLQKPAKQSAFEKQRAEAEAKRKREAAETAAVYEDFVKSFDREDDESATRPTGFAPPRPRPGPGFPAGPSAPGASRRHFGTTGPKSGPGSLGPAPGSFGKKRSYQDFARGPKDTKALLGFEDQEGGSLSVGRAFDASDDEDMPDSVDRAEEKAVAKPTMRLWDLPPGTSPSMLKSLISEFLPVESVRLLPPAGPGSSERKSAQAVAIFSQETPSSDVESAVSSLKGRYLGYGYYLSLDRGPSTAVMNSTLQRHIFSSSSGQHPFDAKPVEQAPDQNNAPVHHGEHRGFAPPTSYAPSLGNVNRGKLLHVPVQPPHDIRTVQIINKVIEGVLEHGPGFEALLMSRPEVQREEKWAWIWNARSESGIWYRWRLWEIITGAAEARKKGRYIPLFEGFHAWKTPEEQLPFEHVTQLEDFVSDSNYDSSDDDDLEEEANREAHGKQEGRAFLNPLKKAKLVHLLARLPTAISRLRKGDIARVTTFAIANASRGSDEVVSLILSNVELPFSLTAANGGKRQEAKDTQQVGGADDSGPNEGPDASAASLVGLYVVSDILSSSSTTNVRHGWRYRPLLETALLQRKTFEHLGMTADRFGWGRLRAEKWKRSIHLVLNLWEGWCSFAPGVHEQLVGSFDNPPLLKAEEESADSLKKGRWKAVEATPVQEDASGAAAETAKPDLPVQGEDVEGEPMEEEDVEGEPMSEEDVEGEPIDEDDVEGEPVNEDDVGNVENALNQNGQGGKTPDERDGRSQPSPAGRTQPRHRMRAVDMFADSDESDGGREP